MTESYDKITGLNSLGKLLIFLGFVVYPSVLSFNIVKTLPQACILYGIEDPVNAIKNN